MEVTVSRNQQPIIVLSDVIGVECVRGTKGSLDDAHSKPCVAYCVDDLPDAVAFNFLEVETSNRVYLFAVTNNLTAEIVRDALKPIYFVHRDISELLIGDRFVRWNAPASVEEILIQEK